MDDSYELLSSMSPKIRNKKQVRKGATLLALRKNMRKSSVYDRSVHTTKNEDVVIDSSPSEVSVDSCQEQYNIVNEVPIVISDTDYTDDSLSERSKELDNFKGDTVKIKTLEYVNASPLPNSKINDIQRWIATVEFEIPEENPSMHDITAFTDVSTIYGDSNNDNFLPKEGGNAINSTFVGPTSKRFNELFQEPRRPLQNSSPESNDNNKDNMLNSIQKLVIEDSFDCLDVTFNRGLKDNSIKSSRYSFNTPEGLVVGNQVETKTCSDNSNNENGGNEDPDIKNLLDNLYGSHWRDKENLIIPKSDPNRKRINKPIRNVAQSEQCRKPKRSLLYKNPYLEVGQTKPANLLNMLHQNRLKQNLEQSPLRDVLNNLCDPESSAESTDNNFTDPKAQLKFDSADDTNGSNDDKERTPKGFKSIPKCIGNDCHLEEKIDSSNIEISLEERIRKKINAKGLPASCKTSTKKSTNIKPMTKSTKISLKVLKERTENNLNRKYDSSTSSTTSSSSDLYKKTDIPSSNKKTGDRFSNSSSVTVSSDDDDREWNNRISQMKPKHPKTGTYTFLGSLSGNVPILKCDMSARIFRNNFQRYKDELLRKLFKLFNEKIFDNAIPDNTELIWNDRLRGTAGLCECKKVTHRNGTVVRSVKIALASKVIDSADRLRDTLVHEMCHAATWIINCVSDGHGKYWKACIGRHTKSLDIERKRCGHCYGKFEVLLNKKTKNGLMKSVPATPKKEANGFALFVKENYAIYKNPNIKHGDIMKVLGQKFQEMKVKRN